MTGKHRFRLFRLSDQRVILAAGSAVLLAIAPAAAMCETAASAQTQATAGARLDTLEAGAATATEAPGRPAPARVISAGGSVTEIVYALGKENLLAGDDISSIYPQAATQLPRVGYYRSLPLEGMLSLQPDLILASENAGPVAVLNRIQALGIPVRIVSDRPDLASLYKRIQQIATHLHAKPDGEQLIQQVRSDIDAALQSLPADHRQPKMRTVVLMKRTSQILAAGSDTAANTLLSLTGLDNILATQKGYKPISAEGLAALQPDLIIVTTGSIDALGGLDAFRQSPGVALTPAALHNHILVMNDLLILGLGPRTAEALTQLIRARRMTRTKP